MIDAHDLEIRIGARLLVSRTNLLVDRGMRIGLVGRNGAGKTTTMRLIAAQVTKRSGIKGGSVSADQAERFLDQIDFQGQISSNGTVGYLWQDPDTGAKEKTGLDRIMAVRGLDKLHKAIAKAELAMSQETGDKQIKAMERYVRLDQEFTINGGHAAHSEAMQIAHNLGLSADQLTQPLDTLSGGQRRRVELARILFSQADVLLLDEPTNHLDQDSILWLRDYLRSYPGGFIVITHSVDLLAQTVNQVWYLDANRGVLDQYNLGWEAYLEQRSQDEARRRKERANALKKAAQLQAQGEKMRAKATKAAAAQQMLRRAQELRELAGQEDQQEKVARIRFPAPQSCGRVPLEAKGLAKSYGSLEVFAGLDLSIDRLSLIHI